MLKAGNPTFLTLCRSASHLPGKGEESELNLLESEQPNSQASPGHWSSDHVGFRENTILGWRVSPDLQSDLDGSICGHQDSDCWQNLQAFTHFSLCCCSGPCLYHALCSSSKHTYTHTHTNSWSFQRPVPCLPLPFFKLHPGFIQTLIFFEM